MGIQRLCHRIACVVACRVALATAALSRSVARRLLAVLPLGSLFARVRRVLGRNDQYRRGFTRRRLVPVCLVLAGIGYLGATAVPWLAAVSIGLLSSWLPAASVATDGRFRLSNEPQPATERAVVVVGSDQAQIEHILGETDLSIVGYVSPPDRSRAIRRTVDTERARTAVRLTDGGAVAETRLDGLHHLGGLSQLPAVLGTYDVDRALLAFSTPDRTDFFGALATCHDHGVRVTVRGECADSVLVERAKGAVVDVELDPWTRRERVVKHCFDKLFALAALLCAIPVIVVIALAIRLDSPGPILYSQDRTTKFGRTFRLFKFRTMTPGSEDAAPMDDEENTHITRVGRFLRRTHLDELPQLYSILVGDMSVVGPRAAWIEEEAAFVEELNGRWRKRWFVKPGLTGLAQINDVSSTNPELKLHYDVEYIHRQSLPFDLWLVCQQLRIVLADLLSR